MFGHLKPADFVHLMEGEFQWSGKIHKQNDTVAICIIPDFMIERIVENQALSLIPMPDLVPDSNPAFLFRLWNHQP